MRRILNYFLLGLLLGLILSWAIGPAAIRWWYAPPQAAGGFTCEGPVSWAVSRLMYMQLGMAACGAIFGLLIGIAFRRSYPKSQ